MRQKATDQKTTSQQREPEERRGATKAVMSHDRFRRIIFDVETWMQHAHDDRQYGYWWGFASGVRRHYREENSQNALHEHLHGREDEVGRGYRDGLSIARGEPVSPAEEFVQAAPGRGHMRTGTR